MITGTKQCALCGFEHPTDSMRDDMCADCLRDELQRVRKERNEFKARLDGMKLNAQATAEATAQKAWADGQAFPKGRW